MVSQNKARIENFVIGKLIDSNAYLLGLTFAPVYSVTEFTASFMSNFTLAFS